MDENINYWRGKPVNSLTADELREALTDVYRQLEQSRWDAQKAKMQLAKATKGKRVADNDEVEEDIAA